IVPPGHTTSGLASYGVQEVAFEALVKLGSAAVPAILELAKDADRQRQRKAMRILVCMGSEATAGISVLIEKLQDEDAELRSLAAFSLELILSKDKNTSHVLNLNSSTIY